MASKEEIVQGFQNLCQEQRNRFYPEWIFRICYIYNGEIIIIAQHIIKPNQRGLQQKLAELRQERGEHELVAETLKKAEPERKAWRLVGKRHLYLDANTKVILECASFETIYISEL